MFPTLLVAIACFAVVFEFLALQLQSGRDPALGNASTSVPAKVRPRKKIIITKVIPARSGGTSGQTTSSSGGSSAPAPVVSSTS